MTETVSPAPGEPAGLRERKKARTRATIRQEALRLFREQGYQATTVEQIAAAAEVSPSTFFRYFPTKEDVVLQDDMEPMLIEALEHQPRELGMVAAIRASMQTVSASLNEEQWDRLRQTAELGMTVPEVRARAMDDFSRTITMMAGAMAKRTGLSPDDLRVRTASGAIFGAIMAATAPWDTYKADQINADLFQRVDEALSVLQESLSLLSGPPRGVRLTEY
jgi:AcrR family transcriptional regulator